MESPLGDTLVRFDSALRELRNLLAPDTVLSHAVFDGTEEWTDLLAYKLVPHLAGEGCLIVAVTGGTNTGKSTVFNLLLGRSVSPVRSTAAATRRPVLAGNHMRHEQCLEGKLVPEFKPIKLDDEQAVVARNVSEDALFVALADELPDRIVLLDTPDVDSIDTSHWQVADNIRAAGDVLIAVLTGEKYKDDRVVRFFRQAIDSGRIVIPLMNKANPERSFEVAAKQLTEFCDEAPTTTPCFVIPHDFNLTNDYHRTIASLDGAADLGSYLKSLDAPAIKHRVYHATVERFSEQAWTFLEHVSEVANVLQSVAREFEERSRNFSSKYDPAPGAAVGGLFHEFVQSKRGPLRRWIGTTSKGIVNGVRIVGKALAGAFKKRATLEAETPRVNEDELRERHALAVRQITRDLTTSIIETSRNLREPAAHFVTDAVMYLDVEEAVEQVCRQVLSSDSVSEEFRKHACRMLEAWWSDNTGKRRALEVLDAILAVAPAAIAVPLSFHTGGVGVPETVAVAGPLVEQFAARVLEYQFGDAMFDFLSPWRAEQQSTLEQALREHVLEPCLEQLRHYLDVLNGDVVARLREEQQLCRKV